MVDFNFSEVAAVKPTSTMPEKIIKKVELQSTLQIRHEVLRFADSSETSILHGDNEAIHFACFIEQNLVGVASIFHESIDDLVGTGVRVRAMAVLPSMQRQGVGKELLNAIIKHAKDNQAHYIWCTVRPDAEGFYKTFGFKNDGVKIAMPHGTFSRMVLSCSEHSGQISI